eukprot:g38872.t1
MSTAMLWYRTNLKRPKPRERNGERNDRKQRKQNARHQLGPAQSTYRFTMGTPQVNNPNARYCANCPGVVFHVSRERCPRCGGPGQLFPPGPIGPSQSHFNPFDPELKNLKRW